MSTEILNIVMTAVILPLLIAISGYLIAFLKQKATILNNSIKDQTIRKHTQEATDAIVQSVDTLFQTYVNELKAKNEFTPEAQLTAFNKAKNTAIALLSDDAKIILKDTYGDFDLWMDTKIEQVVKQSKTVILAPAVVAIPTSSVVVADTIDGGTLK